MFPCNYITRLGISLDSVKYCATPDRTSHVVHQFLDYHERPNEAKRVCAFFAERQKNRKTNSVGASDKRCNPLVAIPGSPGSGKSTFLVNFPDSKEYHEYVRDYYGNTAIEDGSNISAIVSSFTFNSAMGGDRIAVGLRMLFGALKSMGIPIGEKRWSNFYVAFEEYDTMTADEAVQILQRTFGKHRPILVVVDEISRANEITYKKADAEVMRQLGQILDAFDNVDVLVSSLSPLYIKNC